jgi:hypothetical protein
MFAAEGDGLRVAQPILRAADALHLSTLWLKRNGENVFSETIAENPSHQFHHVAHQSKNFGTLEIPSNSRQNSLLKPTDLLKTPNL